MENNKSYLQQIHWIALLGCVVAIFFLCPFWGILRFEDFSKYARYNTMAIVLLPFIGLGIATKKWKEAGIALGATLLVFYFAPVKQRWGQPLPPGIYPYIVYPLTLLLFVAQVAGFNKKTLLAYPVCVLSFFLMFGIRDLRGGFLRTVDIRDIHDDKWVLIGFSVLLIAAFVTQIIMICEAIRYAQGKADFTKNRIIDLGNDFSKGNAWLAFWCIKGTIWKLMINFLELSSHIIDKSHTEKRYGSSGSGQAIAFNYIHTESSINLFCWIAAGLLLAWYLRTLVLEIFFTYDLRSKLLYWVLLLPVIGSIALAFSLGSARRQTVYAEKVNNIGHFVAAGHKPVSIFFGSIMAIWFLLNLVSNNLNGIIWMVPFVLYFGMISDEKGYSVNLVFNLVCLVASCIIAPMVSGWDPQTTALVLTLIWLATVHAIYIFPAIHFKEFEYTPAEDPTVGLHIDSSGETHLFPAAK